MRSRASHSENHRNIRPHPKCSYRTKNMSRDPKNPLNHIGANYKGKTSTQILTLTLGPIELWSFNTTAEDANLRNLLYKHLTSKESRYILAKVFPSGSCTKYIAGKMSDLDEDEGVLADQEKINAVQELGMKLIRAYKTSPDLSTLDL